MENYIDEIQQIDHQLKSSEKLLFKEIQCLKEDYTKLNYTNEFQTIDESTLKIFQDLKQILSNIKQKEMNICNLVQILRVNSSRQWYLFENVTENLIKDSEISNLILLEKEHGDLLIKMKEIQIDLENFRRVFLQITQDVNQIHRQTSKISLNTQDIQLLIVDYQSIENEINYLIKLIFSIQTQIEIYHKSILIYQTKLEKYRQDLTMITLNQTSCQHQILNLQKKLQQQNGNLQNLKNQQIKILQNRQQLHQHIHTLENKKTQILNHQQELLDTIKQTAEKNNLLEKEIFYSNNMIQNFNCSYQKLVRNQNQQQSITNNLQKTIETNEEQLQMTRIEINRFTERINQQNDLINSKENQIEIHTKDLQNLENCLSTTREELNNQRNKLRESQINIKLFTQKMHKFSADEKPIIKEISHYRKQVIQNDRIYTELELDTKQDEERINHYKTIIGKLIFDSKENDRILTQENLSLKEFNQQRQKSNNNIKKQNKNLKSNENKYENLKEIFYYTENENKQLKQQYTDLTFVIQLLGQRQVILNNQLKPLYKQLKSLTTHHLDKVQIIEQSKSDLDILHKYYLHLQTYNHQLHQSLSFTSQKSYEYLHSQSLSYQLQLKLKTNSNHIHYLHTLRINSPEKFNSISKLFLIKNKLVKKSNELSYLKKIFYEKNTLYNYLNQIYLKRQKLIDKMNTCDMYKDQLLKKKTIL